MLERRLFVVFILLSIHDSSQAKPGLIATYTDGKHTVRQVVPTPNFQLKANQSLHSQIGPTFTVVYEGFLKINRGGPYHVHGDAKIEIDGKVVMGKAVQLTTGDHPLKITFTRKVRSARFQLRWSSDFFVEEPIPPLALEHKSVPDVLTSRWKNIEHGRFLYENMSCAACHGGKGWFLSERKAPDLSTIGERVTHDWLYRWLSNPHQYRPTTAMPVLLTDKDEIRDVTTYLMKLGSSTAPNTKLSVTSDQIATGKEIFERIGCAKCHDEKEHSLTVVGSKFKSSTALAQFLMNPLEVDPSGRMPAMFDPKTQRHEAERVAEFLFWTKKGKKKPSVFPGGGNANRGRELIQSRGCISCHSIREDMKPLSDKSKPPLFTKSEMKRDGITLIHFDPKKGCLAEKSPQAVPDYKFSENDRSALRAFLGSVSSQPVVADAPVETFYRRINQFNCTACHSLNGEEPSRTRVTDRGKAISVEVPPSLTGVGDKLQVSWLEQVLLKKKRIRPWMKVRMPHFGEEVSTLAHMFPAASGSPFNDQSPKPEFKRAVAGLKIIGVQRGKAACINCHNYRGINRQNEGVVPAPDLAEAGQSLRREWFQRWIHNPTRLQPGTSMPQFFAELKRNARHQAIEELWSTLYHQAKLPLPAGLIDSQTEGTRILVGKNPVVFRVATILPSKIQIDRAINVGLPGGTNFTFDAKSARLCYAWKGEFLNAAPAWNGRGGKPVRTVGKALYIAEDHFPLRIGDAMGEAKVRFRGYSLVQKYPIFRYQLDGVEIHERIEIQENELVRKFTIKESPKPVRFIAEKGREYKSPHGLFKDGVLTIPAGSNLKFEVRTSVKPDENG